MNIQPYIFCTDSIVGTATAATTMSTIQKDIQDVIYISDVEDDVHLSLTPPPPPSVCSGCSSSTPDLLCWTPPPHIWAPAGPAEASTQPQRAPASTSTSSNASAQQCDARWSPSPPQAWASDAASTSFAPRPMPRPGPWLCHPARYFTEGVEINPVDLQAVGDVMGDNIDAEDAWMLAEMRTVEAAISVAAEASTRAVHAMVNVVRARRERRRRERLNGLYHSFP